MDLTEMAAPKVHEKVLNIILKTIPKGSKVLDVACGEGALTYKLVESGYRVTAADIDDKVFKLHGKVPFVRVDANKPLPFEDESFDAVVSIETIEHLENPYGFVREVNRILRPGGHFILTTPNIVSILSRVLFLLRGRPYGFSYHSYRSIGHITPLNPYLLLWWVNDNTELQLKEIISNCLLLSPPCISFVPNPLLFGQILIFHFQKE